jgi:hypothetical protein
MVNLLESIVNNHIENYIKKISKKFNIPETKLKDLWNNKNDQVIIYKMKNSDNYIHKDTNLVFDSPKNQKIIGRYYNKKILKLNKNDIKLCKKWNFKIGI